MENNIRFKRKRVYTHVDLHTFANDAQKATIAKMEKHGWVVKSAHQALGKTAICMWAAENQQLALIKMDGSIVRQNKGRTTIDLIPQSW